MSEKFTRGPWKATYDSQLQAAIEIYNTEDRVLVAVLPDRGTVEAMPEIEANANLIADAWQLPDLRREIAELKEINKEIAELKEINKEMYEALELAYKNCLGRYGISKDSNECVLYVNKECMIARALRKARGETE